MELGARSREPLITDLWLLAYRIELGAAWELRIANSKTANGKAQEAGSKARRAKGSEFRIADLTAQKRVRKKSHGAQEFLEFIQLESGLSDERFA